LFAILEDGGYAASILERNNLKLNNLMDIIEEESRTRPSAGASPYQRGTQTATTELEKFGRDLTELARQGKLDPIVGRDSEIQRVLEILSRRTKNNPILIGDAGVGKTAIVEGIARELPLGMYLML